MSSFLEKSNLKKIFFISFLFISYTSFCDIVEPRLTVIFVIDQFSYAYINKLKPKLNGGLGFLLEKGVNYNNARYPHAKPATATGHVALNTGVYPKDHGVVGNKWYDFDGKRVCVVEVGTQKGALVFDGTGKNTFDFARSAERIMVPGISDMFVLNPKGSQANYVYALSLKDRSAIGNAGRLGKAIWFEGKSGCFTSSKAYFDELPAWVNDFNAEKRLFNLKSARWDSLYALDSSLYRFKNAFDYSFASCKSMINTTIPTYNSSVEYSCHDFVMTPYSNDVLCDLAERCIENVLYGHKDNRLVLWVSLSQLDKVGHIFGPDSAELIDVIYHIDKRIKKFIKNVQKRIKKHDILFVLTADHGVAPVPELLQKEGMKSAMRVPEKEFLNSVNSLVKTTYGIPKLIIGHKSHQLFVDRKIFDALAQTKKDAIRKTVIDFLKGHPAIKDAWFYDELKKKNFKKDSLEICFQNQLYPGRSGEFIIHTMPYCVITEYDTGTSHATPYQYDTHVPLILFQKGLFEDKVIKQRVSMLQFANTLAEILQVPKPPASTFEILPGLFDKKN